MMGKPSQQMMQRSKAEEGKESQRVSQYQPLKAQDWLEKLDVATKDVVKAD
jgi:LAS superfamily LD-carboxypeptidase LdcB